MSRLAVAIGLLLIFHSIYAKTQGPPNIVLFFMDDQDMATLSFMKQSLAIFGPSPVQLINTFTTTPVCCPSRSTLFTGQWLHNNGAVNNSVAGNCDSLTWQQMNNYSTFALGLQQAGYDTFFAGKYLNTYNGANNGGSAVPPGWTDWHATGSSAQYDYNMSENGVLVPHGSTYPTDYLPLVILQHAVNFLNARNGSLNPFFMMLSLTASHLPDDAEPKYQNDYVGIKVPRGGSYNSSAAGKEFIIAFQEPLDDNKAKYTDLVFRRRLQILETADDIVHNITTMLKESFLINNTHLFYASDNGFHTGNYRMIQDKRLPYDTDIRVPIMWLPPTSWNVQPFNVTRPVALVDLAPTFLNLANVTWQHMDGLSLLNLTMIGNDSQWRTALLIEYRGEGEENENPQHLSCSNKDTNVPCFYITNTVFSIPPLWSGANFCYCYDSRNNTYNCLRYLDLHNNPPKDQMYCEFLAAPPGATNGKEFYHLIPDPYELSNIISSILPVTQTAFEDEIARLSTCRGSTSCFSSLSIGLDQAKIYAIL